MVDLVDKIVNLELYKELLSEIEEKLELQIHYKYPKGIDEGVQEQIDFVNFTLSEAESVLKDKFFLIFLFLYITTFTDIRYREIPKLDNYPVQIYAYQQSSFISFMIEYYLLKNDVEKLSLYIKKFSSSPKKYEKKLKEVYNQILISD